MRRWSRSPVTLSPRSKGRLDRCAVCVVLAPNVRGVLDMYLWRNICIVRGVCVYVCVCVSMCMCVCPCACVCVSMCMRVCVCYACSASCGQQVPGRVIHNKVGTLFASSMANVRLVAEDKKSNPGGTQPLYPSKASFHCFAIMLFLHLCDG